MSNCNNCFNGCTETISDQCIRYTGIDVPELGISTGDPLSVIEQSLATFLVSALNGSGIKINLSDIEVCTLVQQYLPTCGEISIADISKALIQTSCDIQDQINDINSTLDTLNADYTVDCLSGVTSSSDTHAILQATITKLCSVNSSVTSINSQLSQFVTLGSLCDAVSNCINDSATNLASNKMIPYSPIPYYGSITDYPNIGDSFSATGAGIGYWNRVFLCNGQNDTPDLRGRVVVGATNTPSTKDFPTQTDPSIPGNPTYTYQSATNGTNTVQLTLPQIPEHNHAGSTATTIISPNPHSHSYTERTIWTNSVNNGGNGQQPTNSYTDKTTGSVNLTATTTLTILPQGQNEAHSNVQPGFALYYIMYIPA